MLAMRCWLLAIFTILSATAAVEAWAQQAPAGADPASTRLAAVDRTFLDAALESGRAEVAAGELAVENAASEAVRRLGEELVRDHRQGNERLMALARTDPSLRLPPAPRDRIERLARLQGDAFDRAYLLQLRESHERAIELYADAAASAEDVRVGELARQMLPTLRRHAADIEKVLAVRERGRGAEAPSTGPHRER